MADLNIKTKISKTKTGKPFVSSWIDSGKAPADKAAPAGKAAPKASGAGKCKHCKAPVQKAGHEVCYSCYKAGKR